MPQKIELKTTLGSIVIELNEESAPESTKNFFEYVNDGFFDGLVFHRVIKGFMIQGGGLDEAMNAKPNRDPIINEANNGLKNLRGTIAMARTSDPNSATSQFFINHADNDFLNYSGPDNPGYAVFGKTIEGLDVVDAIAGVETTRKGMYDDVPVDPVLIESAKVLG